MDRIGIVFFDIDGTLIDMERREITPRTVEMLRRLKENGVLLCLATGRGPLTLPHFEGMEFDAFLTFNGSCCFSGEGTIFSNPLPGEDVQVILRNAASIHRPVSIATRDRLVANGRDEDLTEYFSFAGRAVDIIPADGGKGEGIRQILSHYHMDRSAALAFGDGDNDIEMLRAVGHGVAMGNASRQVKAAEDGVYHYCLDHGLL